MMTFWSGFVLGIIAVCVLLLVGSIVNNPAQLQPGKYVDCSDYSLITDKYKTTNDFYITFDGKDVPVASYQYDRAFVGGYYGKKQFAFSTLDVFQNLTPSNESVSGYRGACEVMK